MTAPTGPTAAPANPVPADPYAPAEAHAQIFGAAEAAAREALGEALVDAILHRGELTLVVDRDAIGQVLALLRDHPELRFDRLADLTAVDYLDLGREPRFAVVYHLMSRSSLARLRVRALVPEDDPLIASAVPLFPMANYPEREVYDLFGIAFSGHPYLKRIMMPDDWDGHPLRKDYPIGAEEIEFSFNQEDVDQQRPHSNTEREERYKLNHSVNNF